MGPGPETTMGGCMSKGDEDSRLNSDSIERGLDEDSKRLKRECKILLLGLSLYSTCTCTCTLF